MGSDSEIVVTANRWGKVGKVVLFFVLFLLAGVGIGFGAYFRITGFGAVLQKAPEIERKAKKYGMYSTRSDFENAIRDLPKGYEMDAELAKIVNEFRTNTKDMKSNLNPYMNLRRSRKQKRLILVSEMPKLNAALTKSKTAVQEIISSQNPRLFDSWSMEKFFPEYDVRGVEQVQQIQEALLIEAWQEIEDKNLAKAIENIRFEAKIRRYIASHYPTVEGAVYAVESWRTAALAYQRILEGLKSPPKDLISEMQQSLDTPIPFDFRHYSRVCFYVGADWFPLGKTLAEAATDEAKFLKFHPSVVKAWKLHIQLAAIHAYEAGARQSSEIEALDAALETFSNEVYDGAIYSSLRWALPDGLMGGSYTSQALKEAPEKLRKQLQTLRGHS